MSALPTWPVPDVLRQAAALITLYGLHHEGFWPRRLDAWRAPNPTDVIGAIAVAAGHTREPDVHRHITATAGPGDPHPALVAVYDHLDLDDPEQLGAWSDAHADDDEAHLVAAMLRRVAAQAEARDNAKKAA